MSFLKNLFNRKKPEEAPVVTPQPQPAPQPVTPEPAPVAAPAAPVPDPAGSESIRKALDTMSQKLIGCPDQLMITTGMRLQELMREVDDAPCTFDGFDGMIAAAVKQMEHLCQTCKPEQIASHLAKLEAAIAARSNTEENTDKFAPTMQTHYYSVMLIELQGRLNAMLQSIASKQEFIDNVKTLTLEEQMAYQETVMAFTMSINSSQLALMALRKQIAVCRGGLETAIDQLNYDGPLQTLDIATVLAPIYQQNEQFQKQLEEMNRSANAFQVMHAAKVEEQMRSVALAAAAKKQQAQQIAQSQLLTDSITQQIAQMTGKAMAPAAPQAAPQQQAAPVQMAAPAAPAMPAMPDVFQDDLTTLTM